MNLTIRTRFGIKFGSAEGAVDPLAGVSRDAASGILCPANAAEWEAVYTVAEIDTALIPSAVWLMQEGSGNLADSIGSLTLTASGAGITYGVTETGWTRKAITTTEGADGVFTNTDAGLPDIATTSCAILAYCRTTTSALLRSIFGMGPAATRCSAERLATGAPMIRNGAIPQDGVVDASGAIRPWLLQHNRTGASAALYTDQEKIVPVWSDTSAGKQITFGTLQNFGSTCSYVYAAPLFGAAAELTATQWKVLLQTLAWAPVWSP